MAEYTKPLNQFDFLSQFEEEPEEYKEGLKQFYAQTGNRETVRVPFQGGTIVIKRNPSIFREDDSPIVSYHFTEANVEAHRETAKNLARADAFFNAPATFAPFVALKAARPKTQFIHMSGGRYEQNLKIPINQQGMRDAAALSRALNKGTTNINQSQGLLSGAVTPVVNAAAVNALSGVQTKGAIKPGFVKDASGKLVSPGWDTGYRTYLARGGDPANYGIASQAKNMLRDKVDEMVQAKTAQRTRYEQRFSAGQAELKYIKDMQRSDLTIGQKRNIRLDVPSHVKKWIIDTHGLEAYKGYRRWLREGHAIMELEKQGLEDLLPSNVAPAIEHTTSAKGDKSKQLDKTSPLSYSYKDPTTGTYKPVTQRGSDDPTAKFIGSSYRNIHQGATDAYTSKQLDLLGIPQNWEQSAAYYFGFNQFNAGKRLSHSDWMALQSKELSAEQLFSGEKALSQNIAKNITDIHKVEEAVSIKNRYHPDSKHRKKLSKEKRKIEELTWVDPKNYITIKLDRNGNIIPPTVPVEIAPGIMVGPNYKPGNDIALDAVIKKLITDGPSSLDSSGFGGRTNISDRD